jgi:uncharacterized protein (TIRG00374 family)
MTGHEKLRLPPGWTWTVPLITFSLLVLVWTAGLNRELFLVINSIGTRSNAALWSNITILGDSLVIFTLALFFVGRYPRLVWAVVLSALAGAFVVHGAKEWLNFYRPPAVFAPGEINIIGTPYRAVSFPSGHTTAAFTLVGLLCLQRDLNNLAKGTLLVWASMVGMSRMVVGVHWPTDVLGGATIGWLSAAFGMWLAPRIGWGMTPRAQRMFAVALVGGAIALLFHDSGYPQGRALEIVIALSALWVALPQVRKLFQLVAEEQSEAAEAAPRETVRGGWKGAAVRLAVTALIFVLIFRSIDFGSVADVMKDVVPRLLGLALFFQLISTAVAAWRWRLVMRPLGYPMKLPFYMQSYFKGSFFNQGLPTSIGGDAIRVLDVAREGYATGEAFTGVFIDRVLGLVGLLLLNLAANALAPDLLPQGVFLTINLLVGAGLFGFLVLLMLRRFDVLQRWNVSRLFHGASEKLALVLARPRDLGVQFGLSLLVHALSMVAIFLIGRSVGMEQSLGTFMVIVPPVILLTLVPVSLAGWGVREGAMIGLFALVGAPKAAVLSMSILYGLTLIVGSLPGFYVYITGKSRL